MTDEIWQKLDPTILYPQWKMRLKRRILRLVYSQIVEAARPYLVSANRPILLKTDLWVDCLRDSAYESLEKSFVAYGLDLSKRVSARAKKMNPSKSILRANVSRLPFRDRKFDLVMDISTVDHVHPSDVWMVISEYSRVLREDGILLLCIDSKLSLLWEIYRTTLDYPSWSWAPQHAREMVASQDLQILKTSYVNTLLELCGERPARFNYSRWSFLLSGLAQYYMIIARKTS